MLNLQVFTNKQVFIDREAVNKVLDASEVKQKQVLMCDSGEAVSLVMQVALIALHQALLRVLEPAYKVRTPGN